MDKLPDRPSPFDRRHILGQRQLSCFLAGYSRWHPAKQIATLVALIFGAELLLCWLSLNNGQPKLVLGLAGAVFVIALFWYSRSQYSARLLRIGTGPAPTLGALLPPDIATTATRAGKELIIPMPEALKAITIASNAQIAILAVESFRIEENSIARTNYAEYDFEYQGDWPSFVRQNNEAATRFIEENPLGSGYGYILTSTSEEGYQPPELTHEGEFQ
jgi:hypothetical protein